jgi:Peptidase MA superfamily
LGPGAFSGLLSLLVIAWLIQFAPATAQGVPESVKIERNAARPNLPEDITFEFAARKAAGAPAFKWIELAYRPDGVTATTVRRQSLKAGDNIQATVKIDTRERYLPPGTRLSFYWRLGDEQDNTYDTPRQNIIYNDTRFNFKELKNDLLTVRWYNASDAFGKAAFDKAQETIEKLTRQYKIKPDRAMVVTIYPDSRTLFTILPPNSQEWVGGQAIPELGTIVMAISPGNTGELGRTITHEISHLVVHQATLNPYNYPPKWLDEGLAVLAQDEIDGFITQAYRQGRDSRTLFPLRVLNGSFPADSAQSYKAYGQSVEVVRYIQQKYGNAAIEKMLASFKEGRSYDEIVRAGLGISLDDLDRDWRKSIGY